MALKLRIISVGKTHNDMFGDAIRTYESRIRPVKIEWILLPPKSEADSTKTVASESHTILQNLKPAEYVFLLDDRGSQLSSEQFSSQLFAVLGSSKDVCFIIGGAYGVDERVRNRANSILALSKMVLPHQLVRLVLAEQLYRAVSIQNGSGYHHGS